MEVPTGNGIWKVSSSQTRKLGEDHRQFVSLEKWEL